MSKTRSSSSPKLPDEATKKEINRQHALLSADMDKKQLRGNVTLEESRHYRQASALNKKEKREHHQIKYQKKELLGDIRKVRSSFTGHYDDSKSPMENIQLALRTKCQTPPRNSRLQVHGMRRCKSSEVLSSPNARASSSLSYSPSPLPISKDKGKVRPKTAAPEVTSSKTLKRQDDPDPTACKKKPSKLSVKTHKKT